VSGGADPQRAFIGVGANLGDPWATVRSAVSALADLPHSRWVASSSLYRSAPVEAHGPDFVNAVVELSTTLPALELLYRLQDIERDFGRERTFRNAPRTLDLDLLLYGQRIIRDPDLIVPHPRLHERAFVLRPLADLAPDLVHPALGRLDGFRDRVADQPIQALT
jgi:2-amino-4-hydroxy-6-hydroxymethyldihydropteridine diphosphokinase